jgi:hypothetical protein
MVTHGSESYYVIGEGLLAESVGGRDGKPEGPVAIVAAADSAPPPFRFTRMGPKGVNKQVGDGALKKLGAAMARAGGGSSQIPAGFTYLGQFIDHDLTFDKTSVMLGTNITPADMLQARSPSLDLDSLYGAGPADPASQKFYEADGLHLKTGKTTGPTKVGFDLPRGAGNTVAKKRKAIIPDPRNDENLAVAQTHLAMIRFHNRVVDTQLGSVPDAQKFAVAREIVTKHYQWMIHTDYLKRICKPAVVNNVFNQGRKAFEVGAPPTAVPTMPIEFSIAGFRLGHAMVRAAYNWNKIFDNGGGTLDLLFTFSATGGDLGFDTRLASIWIADWRRLYDFGDANKPNLTVPASKFNRAMRIDTRMVDPLQHLPPQTIGLPKSTGFNDVRRNLAFRNLARAKMVKLATGQQMATFLKNKGVNVTKLTQAQRAAVLKDTPLWFYVLREAELNGGRMAGVGGRIVAETFHRAMEGSDHSIVRDTTWHPTLGPNNSTFRMVDLLLFAFEGRKTLLNPNG